MISLSQQQAIIAQGKELGFAALGFCSADPFERGAKALSTWLSDDYHGEMAYMSRFGKERAEPQLVMPDARSMLVAALPYARAQDDEQVARYARGLDYHHVFREKLRSLATLLETSCDAQTRVSVDTAPLLEREAAVRAGIGFIGKSSMLIIPGLGSNVLLGEVLIDATIENTDATDEAPRCGSCTACLDFCPTRAFVGPYRLDATRCISYLTIEHEGPIPFDLRPLIGTRMFGCDVCQNVCPFNHAPQPKPVAPELEPLARWRGLQPQTVLRMTASGYRRLVQGTALRRARRAQLARNAAVALGNLDAPDKEGVLTEALHQDKSSLVRGHVLWAIGTLATETAKETLRTYAPRDNYEGSEQQKALAIQSEKSTTTGA